MQAVLAALWQSDSAFPSGAFGFSNGLEGAVALGGPLDRIGLAALVATTLRFRWATTDRIALLRAFHAADLDGLAAIDRAFEAATLPAPFRSGSRRQGAALLVTHARLGTEGAGALRAAVTAGEALGHLPVVQGWIWRRCGLSQAGAVAASGYTVAAGLAAAAVRLGSLGAIEAQGAIAATLPLIAEWAEMAFDPDAPPRLSSITPWLDIAAVRQARAPLRLFSN